MSPDNQPSEVREVIARVMEYLIDNPDAKDTLDGIERWWLGAGNVARRHAPVELAVRLLVQTGWMKAVPDAPGIYQVSEPGLKEGAAWLNAIHQNQG